MGVLHKNMSIEDQVAQVRKVKRSESGMILEPVTLDEEATVNDALILMSEHKIGGIPVVDKANRLVGIITNRDLRFEKNTELLITKVMVPAAQTITAPLGITLKQCLSVLKALSPPHGQLLVLFIYHMPSR